MWKWLFAILLAVNLLFFAVMHWGGALRDAPGRLEVQAEVQPEKLRIVEMASAVAAASSAASSSAAAAAEEAPVPHLTPAQTLATPAKEALLCFEWGEFSGADLARVEQALAALPLGNFLKRREVEYDHGYWVYMGPFKTRELVERKILQVKARGVNDYYLIQEAGPWQNTLSLGVFKTEEAAKKYLAQLNERGVRSAVVGERESRLKFTVFELGPLNEALAAQVRKLHEGYPGSELKNKPCNS